MLAADWDLVVSIYTVSGVRHTKRDIPTTCLTGEHAYLLPHFAATTLLQTESESVQIDVMPPNNLC